MSRRPRLFRRTLLAIMCLLAARRLAADAANAPCAPFTGETRNQVVDYLRKLAHMPAETTLDLTGSDPEGDTCYRKLEFSMSARPAKMALYLSTDQTFLSPRLFDLSVDPAEVEAGETADSGASGGASESFAGEKDAPITIAVFSDFQCPFCRKKMETLAREACRPCLCRFIHGRARCRR